MKEQHCSRNEILGVKENITLHGDERQSFLLSLTNDIPINEHNISRTLHDIPLFGILEQMCYAEHSTCEWR